MQDKIIFFLVYLLKYNFIFKFKLKYLQKIALCSSDNEDEIKLKKLKKLLKASKRSKFYSDLYKSRNFDINAIKSLEDIKLIPSINKEMIIGKEHSLLVMPKWLMFQGSTSGSSGASLNVFYDYLSVIRENAYVWNYRMQKGLNIKDPSVVVRGNLNKKKLFKFDTFTNTLYISSYNLNKNNIKEIFNRISRLKPKALIGYPSSLSILSKLLDENNYKLCIPLAFTSSESIYSFQKTLIRESFGCKLYDWYGNAERSIALQEEFNEYKEPKLYSINEYHENHIITTSLINNSFPLIRYKVDDRLDIKNEKITAIVGRVDDVVILKDNTAIGRLDHLFKGVSGIRYAQIIQEQINKIDINIVLNINHKFDSELLEKQIEHWLGIDIVYQINFINENQLVFMPSGKFKMVVSSVK
ncbi:hypothetical protein N9H95_03795 [Gammaproteobacteria bacterium]|nr:hypothetical protein [Gammaproteobacteria bacterium]